MEIGIRVEAENIRTGHDRHTNSCYFTMVAVDDEAGRRRSRSSASSTRRRPPQPRRRAAPKLRRDFAVELERAAEGAE